MLAQARIARKKVAADPQSRRPATKVRVLHVLEATLGGTLRYLENIAECLSADEYSLGFAYGMGRADSRLQPFLERIGEQGWSTFPLPIERELSLGNDLRGVLSLRRTIQDFQPAILHCHSSKAGALGRLAARTMRPRPRVVYSPHAIAASLGPQYLLIEKTLKGMTETFLAVSDSEAEEIAGYGLAAPAEVLIAYPMIDPHYFKPLKQSVDAASAERIVLGIGRLTEQKDPLSFVRIVRALQREMPEVTGVWMGEGALREAFLDAAAASGPLSSMRLLPWQHDVRPYLGRAEVMLSTSRYESFGYMVAEALAMEVPTVATAVTGTRDILAGAFAATMYPRGDDGAAISLLQSFLDDRAYSRQWAAAAREMVRTRFGSEAMRAALRKTYDQVLTKQGSRYMAGSAAR